MISTVSEPKRGPAANAGAEAPPPRAMRLAVLGNYGNGNLGDTATLEAFLARIRLLFPGSDVVCFAPIPEGARREHGISAYPLYPGDPPAPIAGAAAPAARNGMALLRNAFVVLRGRDALILSGGGQFDEAFGGPWGYPFLLLKFALLARLAGCELWVTSVGCEVIRTRTAKFFVRCCLSLARYVSFRDEASREFARRIGYAGPAAVYPDLAYSLPVRIPEAAPRAPAGAGWVGVIPLPFKHPRKWPGGNADLYSAFLERVARSLCALARQGYALAFLPSQPRMDKEAVEDLAAAVRAALPDLPAERLLMPGEAGLEPFLARLGRMDFIVAMRFHGVVLASMLGKPVLALSYQRKMSDLMASLGAGRFALDAGAFGEDEFAARFAELASDAAGIGRTLRAAAESRREGLEAQFGDFMKLAEEGI